MQDPTDMLEIPWITLLLGSQGGGTDKDR